ncbi:PREDICTED: protein disulfide-isomerase A3 [Ficedula albicollis]|uniref:protein disulfide-isomerase A3 n=1 Tax=Ficedula albicollis TaxID=59894 RepID=UPI0003598F78|nr:PREDICTED: protein disulfide-isomerase A3 [Ficedula albicollis]
MPTTLAASQLVPGAVQQGQEVLHGLRAVVTASPGGPALAAEARWAAPPAAPGRTPWGHWAQLLKLSGQRENVLTRRGQERLGSKEKRWRGGNGVPRTFPQVMPCPPRPPELPGALHRAVALEGDSRGLGRDSPRTWRAQQKVRMPAEAVTGQRPAPGLARDEGNAGPCQGRSVRALPGPQREGQRAKMRACGVCWARVTAGRHGARDLAGLTPFRAPRCGHCKRLAPEYESAATRLKGIVPLVKVDCTANSNTCNKYGVSGYPTLKIFRDGEEAGTYDGPRTADGIVSHLKKQAGPASVALSSVAEFEKFIGDKDASVVGFFGDASGDAYSEFMKAANSLRDNYRFAHTTEEQLVQKYGEDGEGIVLFRPPRLANKFEESSVKYPEDKITSGKIKKFIQENIFGICPHMTEDNKDLIQGKDLLVAYYDVDYEKNAKGSNYWRNRVMMIAKKFLDAGHKLSYAVASRKSFGHELSEFGLDSSVGEAPVVAIRTAKGDKYVMQEEFSRDGKALERFLQDYFDGNLKKYLKSEPVPESNDGPVKVVVAENFDEIVNAQDKDVLIEFYAPWCGHCKNLEPKYKELGEKLSKDPNIIIAKMDATANDVPSPYEVRGFPTIYFAPAGKKQSPKKYEGGREVSDFISYLKREATNTPVLQEEEKSKKSKKKVKEDL